MKTINVEMTIPDINEIINSIPEEPIPEGRDIRSITDEVREHIMREIYMMTQYAVRGTSPVMHMGLFNKRGSQTVLEFSVSDKILPNDDNKINWHGQNTSRWLYAGAIVIQDGEVSSHH